jgi:RNA polymerase sigma-70 factor (ECF subfamily)
MVLSMIATIEDDGDRAFMLNLYNNYYALVRKTVYSITHDNNDIEDLINDVFVKLIGKISILRNINCCKTASYVVYTTRSVTINYLKHLSVIKKHTFYGEDADIADSLISMDNDMEDRFVFQSDLEALGNAILKLPQKHKDLLHYKYILEMDDAEIAEVLGINRNSVREYLTRARRNAKKLIDKEMLGNGR